MKVMKAGSNGRSSSRRRVGMKRLPMKLPTVALLLAIASQTVHLVKPQLEPLGERHHNRRYLQQQQHQQQQQLQQHQQTSRHLQTVQPKMCSCSPTVFHVRLDFSKDCDTDALKLNTGISGTLCLLGEASPGIPVPSPPSPTTPSPSTTVVAPVTDPPTAFEAATTTSPTATTTSSKGPTVGGAMTAPPTATSTNMATPNPTENDPFLPPRPKPDPSSEPTKQQITTPDSKVLTYSPTSPVPTYSPTIVEEGADAGAREDEMEQVAEDPFRPPAGGNDGDGYKPGFEPADDEDDDGSTNYPTFSPSNKWPTYSPSSDNNGSVLMSNAARMHTKTSRFDDHTAGEEGEENFNVPMGAPVTEFPTTDETYAPTAPTPGSTGSISIHDVVFTEFPTSDETYEPTNNRRELQRMVSSSSSIDENESTTGNVGKWTSIPPNDAFFDMFPEFRERQEEIYQLLRRNGGDAGTSDRMGGGVEDRTQRHRRLKRKKNKKKHKDEDEDKSDVQSGMTMLQSDATLDDIDFEGLLIPTRLLSAQFLEMDTSPQMSIINQDNEYVNATFPPNDDPNNNPVTEYTLSFTSISSMLDPSLSLEDQLDTVPGGVILILVAEVESTGEIVRNRVMWTYAMEECGEDVTVVKEGDAFGWAMFDKLEPAREEFCPASSSDTKMPPGAGSPPTSAPIVAMEPTTKRPTDVDTPTKKPSKKPSTPTRRPSKPSPPSSGTKPTSDSKSGKSHKPSNGLSMPSEDFLDQFNLSKSAKSSSGSSTRRSKASPSSSSSSSSTHRTPKSTKISESTHRTKTTKISSSAQSSAESTMVSSSTESSAKSTKISSSTEPSAKSTKISSSTQSSSTSTKVSSKSSSTKHSSSTSSSSSSSSSSDSSSKTSSRSKSSSSSSRRGRRMEFDQEEDETEVFGRRISQRKRNMSDSAVVANNETGTTPMEDHLMAEFDRPHLNRRVRKRIII